MPSSLKYLFVADAAFVDEKTQKLSAIGIFTDIKIPEGERSVALNFVIAGQLYTKTDVPVGTKGKVTVKILNPDGAQHRSAELNGGFEKGRGVQFIAYFSLVDFSMPGEYSIEVLLNDEKPTKDERFGSFQVHGGLQ